MAEVAEERVPVTVLTGFLGSGKTTLLNRILQEHHGKRIAVIENEFGEVGVDQALVIGAEEEIFEMNNGCICCTVRGDLIRILGSLMKRRDKFDYILVETTGMADPGPVAQTFFVDDEMQAKLRLDGIVTMVDARHIHAHWDSAEALEQIAFADVILLNKTDLVTADELALLETRIHNMNAAAAIHRTQNAEIPIEQVLNVGGFNLSRALTVDPKFLEPEYPFEWGAIYGMTQGPIELHLETGPDPSMKMVLLPVEDIGKTAALEETIKELQETAARLFSTSPRHVHSGKQLVPRQELYQVKLLGAGPFVLPIRIEKPGHYALFTEHKPEEFQMSLSPALLPLLSKDYKPDHEHEDEISSVGISLKGDLDADRFNKWMGDLLRKRGNDLYRTKGVVAVKGESRRYVFQGVHMLLSGGPDRVWGKTEERSNTLIFIGKNLDREELNRGFRSCLV